MALTVTGATITSISADSGAAADFITNDHTLLFGGSVTSTSGGGTGTLGVWISGGSFGTGNGGKGTLVGSTTISATGAYSVDGTANSAADGTYTIHITNGTLTGATDLATHSLTVDSSAAAPTTLDLAAGDDTGPSSTDNITKNTSGLTISGGAETGATVSLFDDVDSSGTLNGGESVITTTTAAASAFSVDISLAQGLHHIRAFQTDVAGNVSTNSTALDITVDTTAPSAPTTLDLAAGDDTGPSSTDNITKNTSGLTIGGGAETDATVSLFDDVDSSGTLNGGESVITTTTAAASAFSVDISLAEGLHHIRAFQTDVAGNVSAVSSSLNITVDATAPSAPTALDLASGDDTGPSSTDNITKNTSGLTIGGGAETDATVSLFDDVDSSGTLNGGESVITTTTAAASAFSVDISLAEGLHHIRAFQTDVAGNVSAVSSSLNITVDATAPSAPTALDLASGDDTGPSNSDNITKNTSGLTIGGGAETDATVSLFDDVDSSGTLNGGESVITTTTAAASAFSVDISLAEGLHHIRAFQTDVAGNVSANSTALDITVDATAPSAPTALDLASGDDTGSSDTDNITKNTSGLTIGGGAETDATVSLFDDVDSSGTLNGGESVITTTTAAASAFSVDISLAEGLHHIRAFQTDVAGNVSANSTALDITVDTTVDGGTAATLTVDDLLISDSEKSAVPVTVAGMDPDATALITFTDINLNTTTQSVSADGQVFADLSGLDDGKISTTMVITDTAGNTRNVTTQNPTLNAASSLVITFGQYILYGGAQLNDPAFTTVTLTGGAGALAALTPAQFGSMDTNGVDVIKSSTGTLTLTVDQYNALGSVALSSLDVVTVRDTGANLATLDFAGLAGNNVDILDSTTPLTLTVAQFDALSTVALTAADTVTLSVGDADVGSINFGALAGKGIDIVDAADGTLTLSVAQVQALGTVKLSTDPVTVADTAAALQGLSTTALKALATKGVDALAATDGALSLTRAQYQSLGAMTLSATGDVILADTGAQLAALTSVQIGGLAAVGVDRLDATNDALKLNVAQYEALGPVALSGSDVVTLADLNAAFSGLDFSGLGTAGVSKIDAAGDNSLTISLTQYNDLGTVTLTSGDTVTLADTGAALTNLLTADIAALAGKGIDKLDVTSGTLTMELAEFNALGTVIVSPDDALVVNGTAGNDSFSFNRQTFTGNDKLVGGAGTADQLSLKGDYSAGLVFGADALDGVERLSFSAGNSYNMTIGNDASNVASLLVNGSGLGVGNSLIFDGSAVNDGGTFNFKAGAGTNTFTGGTGADSVTAGTGADTIRYTAASQSTSTNYDTVTGFNAATDTFDVAPNITGFDAPISGAISSATFDADLAAAANAGSLLANHAAMFTAGPGNLSGQTFLVVDLNGTAGYQAGADLVVKVTGTSGTIGSGNFS